jgi:hypothetical protein
MLVHRCGSRRGPMPLRQGIGAVPMRIVRSEGISAYSLRNRNLRPPIAIAIDDTIEASIEATSSLRTRYTPLSCVPPRPRIVVFTPLRRPAFCGRSSLATLSPSRADHPSSPSLRGGTLALSSGTMLSADSRRALVTRPNYKVAHSFEISERSVPPHRGGGVRYVWPRGASYRTHDR